MQAARAAPEPTAELSVEPRHEQRTTAAVPEQHRHKRAPHPGEVLTGKLAQAGVTQTELAKAMGVPFRTVNRLSRQHCGLSAKMARKLAKALGPAPEFWMDLQRDYALAQLRRRTARPADTGTSESVEPSAL